MLGQPVSMLIPKVVGFKLTGESPAGTTATDLVLTVTEMLRRKGVVGTFVEFYGDGVAAVPLANRATIGNMSPEYGSTCAIFPIDDETLAYLRFTGRSAGAGRARRGVRQGAGPLARPEPRGALLRDPRARPVDHRAVARRAEAPAGPGAAGVGEDGFRTVLRDYVGASTLENGGRRRGLRRVLPGERPDGGVREQGVRRSRSPAATSATSATGRATPSQVTLDDGTSFELDHGAVVIAAITSCTNTSNPQVMIGAALLAKKAVERGLSRKPWVKTTLAPGSKVVVDYYERSGPHPVPGQARLQPRRLRLHHVHRQLRPAAAGDLGGRQRGRSGRGLSAFRQPQLRGPHQPRREDELPRVAAAGRRVRPGRHDGPRPHHRPARHRLRRRAGLPRRPLAVREGDRRRHRRRDPVRHVRPRLRRRLRRRRALAGPAARRLRARTRSPGTSESTYVRKPPYFEGMQREPAPPSDIEGARVLAMLGDSVTTDHISPAGSIKRDSPAGKYLSDNGVDARDFNSYGSRRGNHEVMIRGTFANIRLRNQLAPGTEGGVTRHLPDGEQTLRSTTRRSSTPPTGSPLVVLAGKEYGSGSSRDWAAKGTALLGVRAVIAESYERIHRSNLIGMGVLPLQYPQGESRESLGLTGEEEFTIRGLADVSDETGDDRGAGRGQDASRRWCASTRQARPSTSGTAGSCRTCCVRCSSGDRQRRCRLAARDRAADRPGGRRRCSPRAARTSSVAATKSSPTDVVTAMDQASEALIVAPARRAAPRRRTARRGGVGAAVDDRASQWVVDPLDGTVNYLYGVPFWSVSRSPPGDARRTAGPTRSSVSCTRRCSGMTWTAASGRGRVARRDRRCTGSAATALEQALVGDRLRLRRRPPWPAGRGARAGCSREYATSAASAPPPSTCA